nr:immunoglobulin heavy chain junction region [Macaca mulatta]
CARDGSAYYYRFDVW